MWNYSLLIGKPLGVPVKLHWTWLLTLVFLLCANAYQAGLWLGLFALVLLHELGHCIAGKYFGHQAHGIVLYPFGGCATIRFSKNSFEEFVIALAGPMVNALLILPFWWFSKDYEICETFLLYNYVLLIFNLIPAFPMDGGRVFRATLSHILQNHLLATTIAVFFSHSISFIFMALGAYFLQPIFILIGVLLLLMSKEELSNLRFESKNLELQALIMEMTGTENGLESPKTAQNGENSASEND